MECYLDFKRNGIMTCATTWTDLEDIILNVIS